jgi:hypothetical protein
MVTLNADVLELVLVSAPMWILERPNVRIVHPALVCQAWSSVSRRPAVRAAQFAARKAVHVDAARALGMKMTRVAATEGRQGVMRRLRRLRDLDPSAPGPKEFIHDAEMLMIGMLLSVQREMDYNNIIDAGCDAIRYIKIDAIRVGEDAEARRPDPDKLLADKIMQ